MKNDLFSKFGLTVEQTQILFSLQHQLVKEDVNFTKAQNGLLIDMQKRASVKKEWLDAWDLAIEKYLTALANDGRNWRVLHSNDLVEAIKKEDAKSNNTIWKYLILLECCIFNAYYPLGGTEEELKESGKRYSGLKFEDTNKKCSLIEICDMLSIDSKYIDIFIKRYKSALSNLTGRWKKILVGGIVGVILILIIIITWQYELLGLFALEGLSGAALISSGLAALGGGAVAAGGFGVTGGIAVLVGGGSLLGLSVGGGVGLAIASNSSDIVMSEAAKMEVVLKEIVMAIQKDTVSFQNILAQLMTEKETLKNELEQLKNQQEENKKKIKELEKSIKYLEKLLDQLSK